MTRLTVVSPGFDPHGVLSENLFWCLAAGWLSQNGRGYGRGLAPVVGLLSPGQNGAGNVWLAAKCTAKRREAQLFTVPHTV